MSLDLPVSSSRNCLTEGKLQAARLQLCVFAKIKDIVGSLILMCDNAQSDIRFSSNEMEP